MQINAFRFIVLAIGLLFSYNAVSEDIPYIESSKAKIQTAYYTKNPYKDYESLPCFKWVGSTNLVQEDDLFVHSLRPGAEIEWRLFESTNDLMKSLDIDVAANYKALGYKGNFETDYLSKLHITKNEKIFALVAEARHVAESLGSGSFELTAKGKNWLNLVNKDGVNFDKDDFFEKCGDTYINQVTKGGHLAIMYRLTSTDSKELKRVSLLVNQAFAGGDGKFNMKSFVKNNSRSVEVKLSVNFNGDPKKSTELQHLIVNKTIEEIRETARKVYATILDGSSAIPYSFSGRPVQDHPEVWAKLGDYKPYEWTNQVKKRVEDHVEVFVNLDRLFDKVLKLRNELGQPGQSAFIVNNNPESLNYILESITETKRQVVAKIRECLEATDEQNCSAIPVMIPDFGIKDMLSPVISGAEFRMGASSGKAGHGASNNYDSKAWKYFWLNLNHKHFVDSIQAEVISSSGQISRLDPYYLAGSVIDAGTEVNWRHGQTAIGPSWAGYNGENEETFLCDVDNEDTCKREGRGRGMGRIRGSVDGMSFRFRINFLDGTHLYAPVTINLLTKDTF